MPIQLRQAEYTAPNRRGAGNLARTIGSGISDTAESYQGYLDKEAKRLALQEQARQDEEDKKYTRDMEGKKYGLMERGVQRLEEESEQRKAEDDRIVNEAARLSAMNQALFQLEQGSNDIVGTGVLTQEAQDAIPQGRTATYEDRGALASKYGFQGTATGKMFIGEDPSIRLASDALAREKMQSTEMMHALGQRTLSKIADLKKAAKAVGKEEDSVFREMDDTQLQDVIDVLSVYSKQFTQPRLETGMIVPGVRAPAAGPASEGLVAAEIELAGRKKKKK